MDIAKIILLTSFLLLTTTISCANQNERTCGSTKNVEKRCKENNSNTVPDSIIIIYQSGAFSEDCIKITATKDYGIVEWASKPNQIKERAGQPPHAICDWQRDDILQIVSCLFVEKRAKVVERDFDKSLGYVCSGSSSLEFNIYIGTTCIKEKIGDIDMVETPYYSKQFSMLYNHIKAIYLAYARNYPWACENESELHMDSYKNEAADSITIDCLNWKTKKSYHICSTGTIDTESKVIVRNIENNDLDEMFSLEKVQALQLYKYVSDLFAKGPEAFNCQLEYFENPEGMPHVIPLDVTIKLYQDNEISSFSIKTSLFDYCSHLNIPKPLGNFLGQLIIYMYQREGLRGL